MPFLLAFHPADGAPEEGVAVTIVTSAALLCTLFCRGPVLSFKRAKGRHGRAQAPTVCIPDVTRNSVRSIAKLGGHIAQSANAGNDLNFQAPFPRSF